ncbi:MAG: putative adhesin [Bacteroidota bacterium]|jgi:uncharacterized repeat protein (TIGR01451 family)
MKKTFLFVALFFISLAGHAQFTQPVVNNNACDSNGDGYEVFNLLNISSEILTLVDPSLYTVTHHLNQQEASLGLNPIFQTDYTNIVTAQQMLFARIVNNQTNAVQIMPYILHANLSPQHIDYTINICDYDNNNDGFAVTEPLSSYDVVFIGNNANSITSYHATQLEAETNHNALDAFSSYTNQSPWTEVIYVRVTDLTTNCVTISTLHFMVIYCGTNFCEAPYALQAVTSNQTSIAVEWAFNQGNQPTSQIDLYVVPAGSPAPTANTTSTIVLSPTQSNTTITGLLCNTTYDIYLRNICSSGISSSWSMLTATTEPCSSIYSNPVDLYACGTGVVSCFNLTENTPVILGNLNPVNYQVTYHSNYTNAITGVNPLLNATQYCTEINAFIYVRIVELSTGAIEIKSFSVYLVDAPPAPDQVLTVCFNGPNAATCWDLTQVAYNLNQDPQNVTYFTSQNQAFANSNPITNPTCFASIAGIPTQPTLYYRVFYPFSGCVSVGSIQLISVDCIQAGQPQSFAQCVDANGTACFMLTDNDVPIMGTLNPADYTITYHDSPNTAEANVNPLSSPYCVGEGNHAIYARLDNNNDAGYLTTVFFLNVNSYFYNPTPLAEMSQCDDNLDGNIIFDLTSVQTQLNSSAPLTYFASEAAAQSNSNPIANPAAYSILVQPNASVIYVRENIPNACDNLYSFQLRTYSNCNLASNCIMANSLCNALGIPFINSVNTQITEPGASYGCLNTHPNPTWFYLPVSDPGSINLMIQQNVSIEFNSTAYDVDYIVYGPYTSPTAPCYNQLTPDKVVSCSYSSAATEYPVIPNALPGQYYLVMTTNFSNQPGYIKITDIGNNTGGSIDCSGFRLNAFLDSNANGVQDNNESNFPLGQFQYELNQNTVVHNISSPSGMYNIYDPNAANSYQLNYVIDAAYANQYQALASYSDVHVVIGGGMTTYNFPITILQAYHDLAVTVVPQSAPRPGFIYQNLVTYRNLGNQVVANATLNFTKDPLLTISSISVPGSVANATGFAYPISNLQPFESRSIIVYMQVPVIPTVNAGEYLTNSASISSAVADVMPENNNSTTTEMVVNAFDPNDKVESHGEKILYSTFSSADYLYYTIRFENTGNASAINIVVNDMLNEQLDENTIQMVSASHSYILDRVGRNLNWRFNEILLPPSIENTEIGKGFITFKIKPKQGYAVGTIIPNSAAIYFDFNPAIVTNTFLTKFVSTLGTTAPDTVAFSVYPNPAHGQVAVRLGNTSATIDTIKIYDYVGKCIAQQAGSAATETIDVQQLTPGIYLVEVSTSLQQKSVQKLVIN